MDKIKKMSRIEEKYRTEINNFRNSLSPTPVDQKPKVLDPTKFWNFKLNKK